jgi:hypothetical protein
MRRWPMNAKGKIRGEGGKLARYLMTGEPGKERAELVETRGLDEFGPDPATAFNNLEKWAGENTRCKKAFFHGHIRIAPDERLSDAQWMEALERKEQRLGFTSQPRMVSFHIDLETGEKHLHAAWFRVDLDTERAIDPGLYKNKLNQLSRECEREFGLRELRSIRPEHDRARAAGRDEFEEARRLGTDLKAIRNGILDCFERSDNGQSFAAAIRAQGMELANGDRRDCFVVVDQEGGQHALNKKLTGMSLAEIRERLSDLDRTQLPSVDHAQAMQEARAAMREAHTATRGQVENIRPEQAADRSQDFAAVQSRTTEPGAWDRDAADRAWMKAVEDAAIQQPGYAAAKGRRDDIRADRDEAYQGGYDPLRAAPEAAQTREASERGQMAEKGVDAVSGLFDGAEKAIGAAFDYAADFIAPPPPPTKGQVEQMKKAAEQEKQQEPARQERAEQEARFREILEQIRRDDMRQRLRRERGEERDDDDYDRGRERNLER